MANCLVKLKGSLLKEPVQVRSLMANCSQVTQVSNRLAQQLGLSGLRNVYVTPMDEQNLLIKWKISL